MRSILCVLSEYGYWGEELVEPLELFDQAGYKTVFATPRGKNPPVIPVSMDPDFIDPALGRPVVSKEVAEKVKAIEESNRLDNPINIEEYMPGSPYISAENYLANLEEYYEKLEVAEKMLIPYDALLMVGGSGPIIDMANSQRLHDIVLTFYKQNKLIAAECYATTVLIFARDPRIKKCLLKGRKVTGHPIEFDYKDDYGFVDLPLIHEVPYPLEYMLRDAVGPKGEFIGNAGSPTSVVLDYPILTSRSVASSRLCGEIMIKSLEKGLKRYGWNTV
jgi:putative intracellular protease/amidase